MSPLFCPNTRIYVIFLHHVMRLTETVSVSINLSLLPPGEKNKIELDKQASFLVWKMKQAKAGPDDITVAMNKIRDEQEQAWFRQSVDKYKKVMGVA